MAEGASAHGQKKVRQKPQGLRPQKYNNVIPKSEVPEMKSKAFKA
jgi:hypothetical protein